MVGQDANGVWSYWSSPTAAPQAIKADSEEAQVFNAAVNKFGHIVTSGTDANNIVRPLLYSAFNQAPKHLAELTDAGDFGSAIFINSKDEIAFSSGGLFYTATGAVSAANGGNISGISDVGTALGVNGSNQFIAWNSLPPTGTPLQLNKGDFIVPPGYMGPDGTFGINASATIYTAKAPYSSLITPPATYALSEEDHICGVGPTGQLLGYIFQPQFETLTGALWKDGKSKAITFEKLGTNSADVQLFALTTDGTIVARTSTTTINGPFLYYVLTPKK